MPKNYHLFLKGEVGNRWSSNFTSDMVSWVLDKYKDSEVHVLVNSLGGYTHEGLAISSLFKTHGNVHVHYIGMNASAATVAAMGARRITIDADAMFLVHKCSGLVFELDMKNAEQLDEYIRKLEKQKQDQNTIDLCIAALYARRCKKTKDELLALMSKDSWLTARQALEWGFVDEITDDIEDKQQMSESTAASISSAGMPLPPGYGSGKKGSMLDKFLSFLRSFNQDQAQEDAAAAEEAAAQTEPDPENISQSMDNTTQQPASQQQPAQPAQAQPAQTQAQAQEQPQAQAAAVSDKDAEINALKAQLAERDKTISELRKEPAAATASVTDDKKGADPDAKVSFEEAMEASKAFAAAFK